MRSSTSNSDVQLAHANWRWLWTTALLLALLLLGGWEGFWRLKGFRPVISDDARLWASARQGVRPDSVVFVGSSRTLADIRPADFATTTGRHTVQLAVNGGLSYLVLEQLAADPNFKGTVICEMWEVEIITGMTTPLEQQFINAYEPASLSERSEGFLQRIVQNNLALALPQLGVSSVVKHWWQKAPLPPSVHYWILEDRTFMVDFSLLDLKPLRSKVSAGFGSTGPAVTPAEFVARAGRFEELAARIEQRGGHVIFMRFPVSGGIWEELEKSYPKTVYWDEFARQTRFETIHFQDYPELRFECPDYSHLDMRQSPAFTQALAKILIERKLIERGK